MKRRRAAALVVALAALPAAWAADEAASAPPAAPSPADAGRKVYMSNCVRCHGLNLATNGIGFDLRTFPPDSKERFVRSVMNGKGAMPAWSATLKPEQVDLLWAYIGAVNGWK